MRNQKMSNRNVNNEKGLTLVELLAVLTLSALLIVLLTSLLVSSFKTEENVSTDALLRDEADYYIASLMNDIYTLKESDVCGSLVSSPTSSYIVTKDENGACTNNSHITGFNQQGDDYNLYIKGNKLNRKNPKVTIDTTSKIEKSQNVYKITLVLKYGNKTQSYFTEIHSIKDI